MKPQPGPGRAERCLRDGDRDEAGDGVPRDPDRPERCTRRVDVALAEALGLDQAAPRERRGDREVPRRVGGGRRGRDRAGHMDVDVDELRAERAAECRAQVTRLQPEDHVRAGVVDLEPLDVEGAGLEVRRGRVGVVPGAVVVAVRVGHVEEQRARHEVEEDRARRVRRAARCADGDDVEHARAAGDRDVDAERAVGGGGRRGERSSPSSRRCSSPRRRPCCRLPSCRVTVTGEPATDEPSVGLVTVSVVVPCACAT